MKYLKVLYAECEFGKKEIDAVNRMFKKGWLSGGEETEAFQKEFAKWWGIQYAIAVTSGSAANLIALQSLNLPKGSEVITMACCFPTTISPIYYNGLVPVYVDVDLNSYTINLDEVEKAITKKTKAIMFAHTLGNMCDMDRLMRIVKKHKLKLIEDCCDAVGSKWKGKMAGTFGNVATVSFYPSHHMTTAGHGGMIITNNKEIARTCQSIRDWGRACYCTWNEKRKDGACGHRFDNPPFDHKFFYINLGLNLKMTELQATFGRVQIKRLDKFIEKRKKNFRRLFNELVIGCFEALPNWDQHADVSWFSFPLIFQDVDRMDLMKFLENKGIQTRTLFAGNILKHPAYLKLPHRKIGKLKNSDKVLEKAFYLGVGPKLTNKQIDFVISSIKEYFE